MTTTQRKRRQPGTTANPAQGVRIERLPNKSPRVTAAGRIALPLWVLRDGHHVGDGDLVMTHDEAAVLYSQLGALLHETVRADA